jgi:hypothetical protein
MTTIDPRTRLRWLIRIHGTQRSAALKIGISPAYFSDLLNGRRVCSDRILKQLHLRRIIVDADT